MPVIASDIRIYAAANMPEDNTSTVGGAVNTGIRVVFDDVAVTGPIKCSGDATAGTGNLFVRGRNTAGSIISETVAINGTGFTNTTNSYERLLDCRLDKPNMSGSVVTMYSNITGALIATLQAGVSGVRRPFYDAAADSAGGSQRIFYEKVFVTNQNDVNALLTAQITEVSSGLFASINFAIESGTEGAQTVPRRTGLNAVPTGVTVFGPGATSFPGTDLGTNENRGVWLQMTLAAGAAAANSFYQMQVTGNTT